MKMARITMTLLALSVLAACQSTGRAPSHLPDRVLDRLPARADPALVRQGPDGCFWYVHEGPLETLLVPLRDAESIPICES